MPRPRKTTPKASASKANVDSYKHKDTRKNIPTQELSHLKREEPKKKRYKYDASLDPQLIWTGKKVDPELIARLQDAGDETDTLDVITTPIYIQEKISPEAIINRLKSDTDDAGTMDTLWGDSASQTFTEMVNFYQHEDNWANRMILGDSLEVMNSLLEKEQMKGKVQMVYIDPPYGIKFGSNWQVSTRKRDVKDGKDEEYSRQPEQIKAFRDTWELGIHSYLSYLRERLLVSRELLTETGSCFVQISDDNVHLVRNLMDEVFGSENFVSQIFVRKTTGAGAPSELLAPPSVGDYIVWYAKDTKQKKFRKLYIQKTYGQEGTTGYKKLELPDGTRTTIAQWEKDNDQKLNPEKLPEGFRLFALDNLTSQSGGDSARFPIEFNGKTFKLSRGSWKTNQKGIERLKELKRIDSTDNNIGYVRYFDDFPFMPLVNMWADTVGQNQFGGDKLYVVQTALTIVQRCMLMCTDPGDLVLDPTCGSGTTAFVAEQWGRRWITTDTSRVALALARTRLMTAKYPWYKLKNQENIREGFQYKNVPHITLKSLANDEDTSDEVLYDQPQSLNENEMVRVSGPFTVESLSPHRVDESDKVQTTQGYVQTVVENMRAAGVQTGEKGKRIEFTNLDTISSKTGYLHAAGEYTEAEETKTVAICIGPEYGSTDDDMIRDAIKEASKFYDLLIVAAPAFEGSAFVQEENPFDLKLVRVKINPDLSMGDLLKKTSAANLFVAFGEPDVTVEKKDSQVTVTVHGVDVYDPTTGQLRSSDSDDIACWFIDTNYNEEAFFVTHAYFTGANKPYEKLKKALKAEIDETLWEELYTTTSRTFNVPSTGKIAVKVINHYGDEVMKVITV